MNDTGWGFTKKPTPQRDKPKLHYFNKGRSLCHGTAPIEIRNFTHPEKSPHACLTCIAKKRALDAKSERKLFLLVCTRAGRRHYVSGNRADEGRWTQFKDRARRFTTEQARVAKGKSQAEIVSE